jgi:hypothetical protein
LLDLPGAIKVSQARQRVRPKGQNGGRIVIEAKVDQLMFDLAAILAPLIKSRVWRGVPAAFDLPLSRFGLPSIVYAYTTGARRYEALK